jgi:predicted Zn-dependent protease
VEKKGRLTMMRRQLLKALVLAVVVGFSGIGCGAIRNINLYSSSEEVQLGNSLDKEVRKQMEMLGDARLDSFVTVRGRKLVEHSKRKDIEYNFAVVKDETINAFAIPGGYCYINVGLFRKSRTEAELISVISHEISHVVHQHSMKRLSQANLAGALTETLLGNKGTAANLAANLFTNSGMLFYSREAEREADRDGLLSMYEAGYDPQGMVEMFEMLMDGRKSEPSAWANLFSTHPMTNERIENARALIAQLPPKDGLVKNSPQWEEIRAFLNETYPLPEKKEDKDK